MTLQEWLAQHPRTYSENCGGCWYVLLDRLSSADKWALWHLSDYAVSTQGSDAVWLVSRKTGS